MEILMLVCCYVIGSIPFGLLVGFLAGIDVREHGSGNIGFTNVLRTCGKAWGIPVLILDMGKGFVPVFWGVGIFLGADNPNLAIWQAVAGVATVLGHNFPVWLKFKGGKGVATGGGALAGLVPVPFLIGLSVFILLVAAFRYISIGSMSGAFTVFAAHTFFSRGNLFTRENLPGIIMSLVLWLLVMVSHRSNIGRLLRGEENKLGARNKTNGQEEDSCSGETIEMET